MAWKDLFSAGASDYARFRPTYPAALFAWLAEVSPQRELAVDVGTGNGQAAVALAAHFPEVIGLDPSDKQIANAQPHPRVHYRVARAEQTGLPDGGADLIVAAQCFHWFDAPAFFAEATRLLRPAGIVALISYGLSVIDPAVDQVVRAVYDELGPFWEPERRLVEEGYRHVQAPPGLLEIDVPPFQMHQQWTADQLLGYLGTWSPLPRYRQARGRDPLDDFAPTLLAAWGSPTATRTVTWPLARRVFRRA